MSEQQPVVEDEMIEKGYHWLRVSGQKFDRVVVVVQAEDNLQIYYLDGDPNKLVIVNRGPANEQR